MVYRPFAVDNSTAVVLKPESCVFVTENSTDLYSCTSPTTNPPQTPPIPDRSECCGVALSCDYVRIPRRRFVKVVRSSMVSTVPPFFLGGKCRATADSHVPPRFCLPSSVFLCLGKEEKLTVVTFLFTPAPPSSVELHRTRIHFR